MWRRRNNKYVMPLGGEVSSNLRRTTSDADPFGRVIHRINQNVGHDRPFALNKLSPIAQLSNPQPENGVNGDALDTMRRRARLAAADA
jgi:hypothetical protein